MDNHSEFLKRIEKFNTGLKSLNSSYKGEKIDWRDYFDNVKKLECSKEAGKLESMVKDKFIKILEKIDLHGAEVLDCKVKCNADINIYFDIKITKLKYEGIIFEDKSVKYNCPYSFLHILNGDKDYIDKNIKEFMKDYYVRRIINPDH